MPAENPRKQQGTCRDLRLLMMKRQRAPGRGPVRNGVRIRTKAGMGTLRLGGMAPHAADPVPDLLCGSGWVVAFESDQRDSR